MVKLLINIFVVYLLVITVKPCGDELYTCAHSSDGGIVHVEDNHHEDEHSDACSPLCSCLCCSSNITNPKYFSFNIYKDSFNLFSRNLNNLSYSISPPVSPPPKA